MYFIKCNAGNTMQSNCMLCLYNFGGLKMTTGGLNMFLNNNNNNNNNNSFGIVNWNQEEQQKLH
jgi:hypothetical protein